MIRLSTKFYWESLSDFRQDNSILNIVFLFVVMFLSGCAIIPPESHLGVEVEALGLEHQKRLAPLQSWVFDGRVSIKGGKQNGSASLLWQQNQSEFDLRLSGPLGRQMMHVWGDDVSVFVDLPKRETLEAENINDLMRQSIGWQVPVDRFRYWVKGAFAPGDFESYQLDVKGRLKELKQDGWTMTYKRYSNVNHVDLPGKVFLSREPYEVRMVVNHWEMK